MPVTLYSWDDAGAPLLTTDLGTSVNAEGSLIRILKACLVDGYGAKAGAGWTMPFSSNTGSEIIKAVFRNTINSGGTGTYFRFVDDQVISSTSAHCRGYGIMSTVDIGGEEFPTTAQMGSQGGSMQKWTSTSRTSTSNSGKWWILGNENAFYLILRPGSSATQYNDITFFGDIISFAGVDPYKAAIITSNSTTSQNSNFGINLVTQTFSATSSTGMYIRRNESGLQFSQGIGIHGDYAACDGRLGYGQSNYQAFPNPVDGNLLISNVFIHYGALPNSVIRGVLPGIKAPLHRFAFSNLTTHTGEGDLSGKTYKVFNAGAATSQYGQVMLETSDTWYI